MLKRVASVLLFCSLMMGCGFGAAATAQQTNTAAPEPLPEISNEQLTALINDLEDPAARERLIQQLKALSQAKAAQQPDKSQVQDATAELLQAISAKVQSLTQDIAQLANSLNTLPYALSWLRAQLLDPAARQVWIDILTNLSLVLGAGYAVLYGLRWLLLRPHRKLARRASQSLAARALLLFLALLLDLLPIAAFAAASYLMMSLIELRMQTRLVALAWINAAIITRSVVAIGRLIFAPTKPHLRLLPISDETAHYADIWIRRLSFTALYGYFALQAALLLGLPKLAYAALLRLLGLIVAALIVIFIVQNRSSVAAFIRGEQSETAKFRALRNRFAEVWFIFAALYVLVLYSIWALPIDGGFLFLLRASVVTLLIMLLGHYLVGLLEQIFARGFRISQDLKARFPGLEARANRYIPLLQTGCRWLIYLVTGMAILQAWGLNTFAWLFSEPGRILSSTVATIIAIVVISFMVWELVSSQIERYLAQSSAPGQSWVRSSRIRTLLTVARNALLVVLLIMSSLLILAELGVNITPLLAGAGVVGIAVGFGSQTLVKDIITGVFILFEDLFAVGDVVKLGDKDGVVEAVSIRNVRLRDLSGTVHTIPFSAISTVSNLTRDFSYYVFAVNIAYREDVDRVMQALKQIGAELQQDPQFQHLILEPLEILGVDGFADSAVVIKARFKTRPSQQWKVGREFNRRMKKRFDELSINIPS